MATKVTSFEIASRELQPILNFIKDEKKAGRNIEPMDFLKKDEFKNSPFRTRMKEIVKFLEDHNFTKNHINNNFPLREIEAMAARETFSPANLRKEREAKAAKKDGNKLGKKKAAAQDKSTKVPKRKATKAPTREATKTPTREATKAPARTSTKAPTRKATEAPVKKATKAHSRKATKVPARKPSTPIRNLVRPTAKGAAGEQGMLDFTPRTTTNLPEEDDLGRSIRKSKEAAKPSKPDPVTNAPKETTGSRRRPQVARTGTRAAYNPLTDQFQRGAASRTAASTAGRTAASTAAKRGILSTVLRGGGALAGGGVGMGLLALSMLPMLLGSAKMSANKREAAREEGRLAAETRRRQLMNTLSPSAPQGIADSLYRDQLRSAYRQETKPGKNISPELASLLGESQGKLQEISRQGGGMTVGQILERFDR